MVAYRLNSPIVGVEHSATGLHIRQIAAGAVLTVADTAGQNGFLEVAYCGRKIAVFSEDLRKRAVPVEELRNTA